MASNTTFGATIVPTPAKQSADGITLPPPVLDSPVLTPAVSREDLSTEFPARRVPIHSPFYQHPPASFERVHSRQNSKDGPSATEKDLEPGVQTPLAGDSDHPFASKVSVDCSKECRMWPSKQTLIQSRKEGKKKRMNGKFCGGCAPVRDFWARFTARQRLYIKIALALFFVGVVVAIAVGITVAVNGTVYVSDGHTEAIPEPGDGD